MVLGFLFKGQEQEKMAVVEAEEKVGILSVAEGYLEELLCDSSLRVKSGICGAMVQTLYHKGDDLLWIENELASLGYFQLAQLVRFTIFNHERRVSGIAGQRIQNEWRQMVIELDIKGRWIIQREIFVKEELHSLRKSVELISTDNDGQVEKLAQYEKELTTLNDAYWAHHRDSWKVHSNIPQGGTRRGFEAWRKKPDWYLTPFLREDCAGKGGCCGRDCGCCEKPRGTSRGQHSGHCTSACPCCIRTRGVIHGNFDDLKDFPFNLVTDRSPSPYSARLGQAYIWGVEFYDLLE